MLSVREDVYGRLTEVGAALPGVFERSVRVGRLSREPRRPAAIREPLLRHGAVAFDEPFVETLVDDLDALSGPPPGEIEPGVLQIVCAALFERARALRDQGRSPVISAALYADGAEAICVGYLDERLRSGLGDRRRRRGSRSFDRCSRAVRTTGSRRLNCASKAPTGRTSRPCCGASSSSACSSTGG